MLEFNTNFPVFTTKAPILISNNTILSNFFEIIQTQNKINFYDLFSSLPAFIFIIGSLIFLGLFIFSIYLDLSLRNQCFYVFDNCTTDDYIHEYIVKLRFGLSREFKNYNDLVIEFYNSKFKPLSKFSVNGHYLEHGLNIGTKLCPGMKITTLYLFKQNPLNNLEYCRVYLNTINTNIVVHLYSIEVGNDKEVKIFFFNNGISRWTQNCTEVSLTIEEPITAKYNGPIMETSYLQATLFIYFFFLMNFFLCKLLPFKENNHIYLMIMRINQNLIVNSTLNAFITSFLYLIFREFLHRKYGLSNGSLKLAICEFLYISILMITGNYLSLASLLTKHSNSKEESNYFWFVISCNCTLLLWVPIGLLYFYLFSPSNYHLGRIIMKNTNQHINRALSNRHRKSAKPKILKTTTPGSTEDQTVDENDEATKAANAKNEKPNQATQQPQAQPQFQLASPQQIPQIPVSAINKLFVALPYQYAALPNALAGGALTPVLQEKPLSNKNISPITYINDLQFLHQGLQTELTISKPNVDNQDLSANIVSPYKSLKLKDKPKPKKQVHEIQLSKNEKEKFINLIKAQIFKKKSLDKVPPTIPVIPTLKQSQKTTTTTKDTVSKTSLTSTGSDYYQAIFKEGRVPKVGSISQYGSALFKKD